jgi:hypothetical protein
VNRSGDRKAARAHKGSKAIQKICPCAELIKHYAMKEYGAVDVYIHIFLTSALVGGEWSASLPCRFTPGERAPGTHWIGGWMDPRVGLDDVEKILHHTGTRTPTRRSFSL